MKVKIMAKDGYKVIDLNRRKAIHERCLNCSCFVPSDVANCSFPDCPLYAFRTGRGRQNPKERARAIRRYCLWCQAGQPFEIRKCPSVRCSLFAYRLKDMDQSTKINSMTKSAHIETVFEAKTKQETIGI